MDVHIGELSSTIHAVEGGDRLSPEDMQRILQMVLRALREEQEHQERVRAEQRISSGVRAEMEEEWP